MCVAVPMVYGVVPAVLNAERNESDFVVSVLKQNEYAALPVQSLIGEGWKPQVPARLASRRSGFESFVVLTPFFGSSTDLGAITTKLKAAIGFSPEMPVTLAATTSTSTDNVPDGNVQLSSIAAVNGLQSMAM